MGVTASEDPSGGRGRARSFRLVPALLTLGAALLCALAALLAHQLRPHGLFTAPIGRSGKVTLQPGEVWAAGPHYQPPPHPAVERVEWGPARPFAAWLEAQTPRRPLILTNTLVSTWRATVRPSLLTRPAAATLPHPWLGLWAGAVVG